MSQPTVGKVYDPYGPLISPFPILRKFNIFENVVELTFCRNKKILLKLKKFFEILELWEKHGKKS